MLFNKKTMFILLYAFLFIYSCSNNNKNIKPAWIKVINKTRQNAKITGKITDNEIEIKSSGVAGFELKFITPLSDELKEPFSIRINNHINYYGNIPVSKKLYFFYDIIFETNFQMNRSIKKTYTVIDTNKKIKKENKKQPEKKKNTNTNLIFTNGTIKSETVPKKFIPGKDTVKIKFVGLPDNIKKWEVDILLENNKLFKKFKGTSKSVKSLEWDGRNDKGKYIPNGMDCYYKLKYSTADKITSVSKRFKLITGLQIKKKKKKLTINFSDILFKKNSFKLNSTAKKSLNKVKKLLETYNKILKKIIIEGHTDNSGNKKYNKKLSEKRADMVLKYLISGNKTYKNKIEAIGYGDTKPLFPNTTDENRKKNRHVNIIIKLH